MKVAAASIAILALLIAAVSILADCESAGRTLTLADGRQIPMKCHWTGQAEVGLSVPILGVGIMMGFTRRKQSYRILGLLGMTLGVVAVLLPTVLIGVCGNPDMPCNAIMKPALIFMGILLAGISLAVVIRSWRAEQEIA